MSLLAPIDANCAPGRVYFDIGLPVGNVDEFAADPLQSVLGVQGY